MYLTHGLFIVPLLHSTYIRYIVYKKLDRWPGQNLVNSDGYSVIRSKEETMFFPFELPPIKGNKDSPKICSIDRPQNEKRQEVIDLTDIRFPDWIVDTNFLTHRPNCYK